jgi:hypothetical protein
MSQAWSYLDGGVTNVPELPARRKVTTMSTTSSTTGQAHHLPILASLAVAALIAAGSVAGVAWHASGTSGTGDQVPALTPPPAASVSNARVAERNLENYVSNARVAERNLGPNGQYDGGQKIGRGDFLPTTAGGEIVGGP